MKYFNLFFTILLFSVILNAQDLSYGLIVNDLEDHPMQPKAKPAYLDTIIDPSFGTIIRRITDAGVGNVIKPMYSTVQAWNADESLMIVYNQSTGNHQLLDGMTYEFIRNLDFWPSDIEDIFWDFDDPDILYYLNASTDNFIRYHVSTQNKDTIANLNTLVGCDGAIALGNDVQMMSWDSDVIGFRCGNETVYSYRISTDQVTTFDISNVNWVAPGSAPSGNLFYHRTNVYDSSGNLLFELNETNTEHSCLGRLANGNDAHFAVAFEQGPEGGCMGNIIAHDLTTGECFPIISQSQGYPYPKSGTHISAVTHKNTEGGWVAASMIGFAQNGQTLLDQELVIAKAEEENIKVCRIGHHRSDEDEFDYWGEPHACISPTGTRVLFGSDWSGSEDGESIDCYVVELPSFNSGLTEQNEPKEDLFIIQPNPAKDICKVTFNGTGEELYSIKIFNELGQKVFESPKFSGQNTVSVPLNNFTPGNYIVQRVVETSATDTEKLIVLK